MAEFSEVFGFDPGDSGSTVREAQQLVIDAVLRNMAHAVTIAEKTLDDLRRALGKGIADSASVLSFAGGLQKVERQMKDSQESFDEAARLAKAANFAVLGAVEDTEVQRIFGLATTHRPLNGIEQQRVKAVLEALAAAYDVAEEELGYTQRRRPSQPTQKDVNAEATLEQSVATWKARFWEAHGIAEKIGYPTKETRDEHLPRTQSFLTPNLTGHEYLHARQEFVRQAKVDLI